MFSIIILVYLYLVLPANAQGITLPDVMYAHRGLHDEVIPENSLSAFQNARDNGFGVELDVQYTKDKKIVVFHDDTLTRMCGIDKKISDFTYAELKEKVRLKNTNEIIPLFAEVLNVMDGLPVICEIKPQFGIKNTDICTEVYECAKNYKGFMCVESFSPFVVWWFKNNAPDVVRGQLAMDDVKEHTDNDKYTYICLKQLLTNFIARPHFVAYRYTDNSFGLDFIKAFTNVLLVGWTPKGNEAIGKARSRFDYVIFEKENSNEEIIK